MSSQFKVLYDVRIRGNYEYLVKNTDELISFTNQQEPKNWLINYEFGLVLARLCGCKIDLVRRFIKFVENSLSKAPNNIQLSMELAHQHYLAKNYQNAVDLYKKVARLDDSATGALVGLIKCRIAEGDFNEEVSSVTKFCILYYYCNF